MGTGGYLLLLREAGWETLILDLTEGDKSTNGTIEERRAEAAAAAGILGLSQRLNCRIPDCTVNRASGEQLACVVGHIRTIRPDLMLIPFWEDDHPDHIEGSRLVVRARYLARLANYLPGEPSFHVPVILFYPCRKTFKPTFVVDITNVYGTKERAVGQFRSQIERTGARSPTPLNEPQFLERLRARAHVFGSMVGADLGEGYLATEPLMLGQRGWMIPGGEPEHG
jgi:bacillithiol biosynthesis deacetylase BshB1